MASPPSSMAGAGWVVPLTHRGPGKAKASAPGAGTPQDPNPESRRVWDRARAPRLTLRPSSAEGTRRCRAGKGPASGLTSRSRSERTEGRGRGGGAAGGNDRLSRGCSVRSPGRRRRARRARVRSHSPESRERPAAGNDRGRGPGGRPGPAGPAPLPPLAAPRSSPDLLAPSRPPPRVPSSPARPARRAGAGAAATARAAERAAGRAPSGGPPPRQARPAPPLRGEARPARR